MDCDATPMGENKNIIDEVNEINQMIRDPKYQGYSRTTYWHQQNSDMGNKLQNDMQREINESLTRIESKLSIIISLLESR